MCLFDILKVGIVKFIIKLKYENSMFKNLKIGMLLFLTSFAAFSFVNAQTLPSSYDPRIVFGKNPASSNQGGTNNCWIHSSVATAELNYMKKNPSATPLKFSENYYNYLRTRTGFEDWNPYALYGGSLDAPASTQFGTWAIMNYMVEWKGPVLDTEFPYSLSPNKQPNSKMDTKPAVHVQGYEIIPNVGASGGPTNHNDRVKLLKEAIFNNGAFALGYGGHSMSFVGWDDNENGGSFLQKESYGGDAPSAPKYGGEYKWHPYSTSAFGSEVAYSVNDVQSNTNYQRNYSHTKALGAQRKIEGANVVTMANVFTAVSSGEKLDAVGFSTVHPNTNYEIYVNKSGDALNATSLVRVGGGTAVKPGYRTIEIDQQTLGAAGTKFAVAVKYTLPSGVNTFYFQAQSNGDMQGPPPGNSVTYGINKGESFYNTTGNLGGTWADMAEGAFGGKYNGSNVPIRAYTGGGTVVVVAPTITTVALNSGKVGIAYSQTLFASGVTPITWTITNGTLPAGLSLSSEGVISGTPTADGTSAFTVRATNSVGSNSRQLSIIINNPIITIYVSSGGKVMDASTAINNGTAISVNSGSNKTFTFVADDGFKLGEVKVNGTKNDAATNSGTHTLSNIRDDVRIDVVFVPEGGGDMDCSGFPNFADANKNAIAGFVKVVYEGKLWVNAVNSAGANNVWNEEQWTMLGICSGGAGTPSYNIAVNFSGGGRVRNKTTLYQVTNGQNISVSEGNNLTLDFTADDGYEVYLVKVDGNIVNADNDEYTFSSVNASSIIEVTFKLVGSGDDCEYCGGIGCAYCDPDNICSFCGVYKCGINHETSIKDSPKSDNLYGIRFVINPVSDKTEINVILPNKEKVTEMKIVIYDMTGNIVFVGVDYHRPTMWNLQNQNGRFVANGTYLVIAEVKDNKGMSYHYSAKLGVKR